MSRVHQIDLDQFDKVVAAAKKYEKAIDDAKKEVADIVKSLPDTWKGEAAEAFKGRVTAWDKDFQVSQDELKRLRVVGESIITNYRNAFRANAQMLNGL